MISTVSATPSLGDTPDRQPQSGQEPPPVPFEQRPKAATPTGAVAADLRIMVDVDPQSGELNYSLVNRQTGAVTSITKNDLLRMSESPDYQAGALINAKA